MAINIRFKIKKIPLLFFVLIGSITAYHAIEQRNFVQNVEYTIGVVIDISEEEHARGVSYYPIIEFVAQNNKSYQFKANIVNKGHRIGDDVGVGYLKDDISTAIIWEYAAIWSRVYVLSFLTAISFFTGIGLSFNRT